MKELQAKYLELEADKRNIAAIKEKLVVMLATKRKAMYETEQKLNALSDNYVSLCEKIDSSTTLAELDTLYNSFLNT